MGALHELWQDALKEEDALRQDFVILKEMFSKNLEGLLARPVPLRAVFRHLREHAPILTAPGLAVISRYDNAREVLEQEAYFSVTEIYAVKMRRETGDFVLGMGDTPQYRRERALMQQAVHPGDIETVRRFVTATADALVASVAAQGRIDVVGQLSRVAPSRLVGFYFGTPGPDEATQMRWMRSIFRDIFLNLGNDEGTRNDAIRDAAALSAYMDTLIATRKADIARSPAQHDNFLSRLLKIQLAQTQEGQTQAGQTQAEHTQAGQTINPDDDTIRRILGGTIVGTVDTNSKAIAQALDQLLDRPDALALAQDAAMRDDDDMLAAIVFEALRFNPQNPFLLRHCEQDYTVARDTPRETRIAKGSLVVVGNTSAMFDETYFPDAEQFDPTRPAASYMHFGHGQHTCFGQRIAHVVIPATLKSLLQRPGLRRAANDGHIHYDGAFPDSFMVEFAAS